MMAQPNGKHRQVEVQPRATGRTFTAVYKRRILAEVERLAQENAALKHKLEQAEAIIDTPKKAGTAVEQPGERPQMSAIAERLGQQIGLKAACAVLGVARSRLYRARQPQVQPMARRLPAALTSGRQLCPTSHHSRPSPAQVLWPSCHPMVLYWGQWRSERHCQCATRSAAGFSTSNLLPQIG
jgi:hypothetical protein